MRGAAEETRRLEVARAGAAEEGEKQEALLAELSESEERGKPSAEPGDEHLARQLQEAETRLADAQQRTADALERASKRLGQVEERAKEAESRAEKAETPCEAEGRGKRARAAPARDARIASRGLSSGPPRPSSGLARR